MYRLPGRLTRVSSERSHPCLRMVRLPPSCYSPREPPGRTVLSLAHAHAAHASLGRKPGVGGGSLQIRSAALCCAMLARALAGDGVRLSRGLRFVATCRPRVIRPGCVVPPHLPAVRPPRHHRRRLVIHFGSRAQITYNTFHFFFEKVSS